MVNYRDNGSIPTGSIPAALREREQWVVWRSEERAGKTTKVPRVARQPKRRASSTDPSTWETFEQANAAVAEGLAAGIGYVFADDDPFVGIDLDDCVDDAGELHPEAARLVERLDSYSEWSPSGRGLHVFVRGELPGNAGRRTVGEWGRSVEVYAVARYFTVTGHALDGTPAEVNARQEQLDALLESFPEPTAPADEPLTLTAAEHALVERARAVPDDELMERARGASNGEKLARLWSGDSADYDGDESRADYALAGLLAFWTGPDLERIERLMRESGLVREKWGRHDYLPRTIRGVLSGAEQDDYYPWPEASDRARDQAPALALESQNGELSGKTASIGFAVPPDSHTSRPVGIKEGLENPRAVCADSVTIVDTAPVIGRTARALIDTLPPEPDWLVSGVMARGWTVKLAGREKVGKGVLSAYLLGKLEHGEPTVFGPAHTEPVTALIYTEEPEDSLREKLAAFGVERATVVFTWELGHLTTWQEKVEWLTDRAVQERHGLIFLDNISRATGTDDEAGTELARRVELLADRAHAKAPDLTVFFNHHHRKSGGKIEDLSRGSTALAAACENNVEIERRGDWTTRERRLSSRGRMTATLWQRTIALSEDGTDYAPATDEDFRLRVLRERDEWTAQEFAAAIDRDESTARKWLRDSPHVTRGGNVRGSRGVLYRVTEQPTDMPPI